MRLSQVSAALVLLHTLTFAQADSPRETKVDEPTGLLEVDSIFIVCIDGQHRGFNQGRQFAISINKHIPEAKSSRAKLSGALEEQKQLDQVVFSCFGKEPPKRLNLLLGDKVPVHIAQAVIAAFAKESKVPVYIALATKDGDLGNTYRVYVGGLTNCGNDPLSPEQIRELLKPGCTRERLAKLLPKLAD